MINKSRIALSIAALAVFTACTKSDFEEPQVDVEAMLEAGMAPSDQKIELSATLATTTRASIESDKAGNFSSNSNDVFGVMMLATGFIPKWSQLCSDQSIDWGQYHEDEKTKEVSWVINKVHTAPIANREAFVMNNQVKFWAGDMYYPIGSYHKYSFYAYNPRVKNIEYHPNQVIAVMDSLDGSKDVMWACIEPSSVITSPNYDSHYDMAFCADYWRLHDRNFSSWGLDMQNPPAYMKFNFKHKMMRFDFKLLAGADDESLPESSRVYDNAYKVKVRSISITNVPDTVTLIVADRNNKEVQGTLSYSKSRNRAYYLKQYRHVKDPQTGNVKAILPDSTLEATSPLADADGKPVLTPVGQGLILPVLNDQDRQSRPYQLQVVVEYEGKYYRLKKNISLDTFSGTSFEAGKFYTITLKIFNPVTSSGDWMQIDSAKVWDYLDPDFISPEEQAAIDKLKQELENNKNKK